MNFKEQLSKYVVTHLDEQEQHIRIQNRLVEHAMARLLDHDEVWTVIEVSIRDPWTGNSQDEPYLLLTMESSQEYQDGAYISRCLDEYEHSRISIRETKLVVELLAKDVYNLGLHIHIPKKVQGGINTKVQKLNDLKRYHSGFYSPS